MVIDNKTRKKKREREAKLLSVRADSRCRKNSPINSIQNTQNVIDIKLSNS